MHPKSTAGDHRFSMAWCLASSFLSAPSIALEILKEQLRAQLKLIQFSCDSTGSVPGGLCFVINEDVDFSARQPTD